MMKSSDPHDNPTKELADIFIKGAELGWNLWVLKMRFEVSGHRSLRQLNQPNTFSFDARSEYLQADRLNAEALDNDAEALDGNEIELVVSPAVVAVDTEAEDGHGLRTVWVKAIVLVGDRRPNA